MSALTEAGRGVGTSSHTEVGVGTGWASSTWRCNNPASVSALTEGEGQNGLYPVEPAGDVPGPEPQGFPSPSVSALMEEEQTATPLNAGHSSSVSAFEDPASLPPASLAGDRPHDAPPAVGPLAHRDTPAPNPWWGCSDA